MTTTYRSSARDRRPFALQPIRLVVGVLKLFFCPVRFVLIMFLMAFARGLGGPKYVPQPAPRNLPVEVEKKK